MSHYNSYNKNSLKKYPPEDQSYLNKKRQDHEMDSQPKKRYDYEDKYDRYDKYDKYQSNHQCKYHIIKDFSQNYYQHNSGANKGYRNRDSWYLNNNKYHGSYSSKSPRRDYKKSFQKYSAESEGVRNLSHCEMPSPQKKQEDQNEKEGLIQGINNFVSNIVSSQFPQQQGTYQHIFQNQQHINIKINLGNSGRLNLNNTNVRKKNSATFNEAKEKKEKDEMSKRPCPVPRPQAKVELIPFQKDSINIEPNPFDTFSPIPNIDLSQLTSWNEETSQWTLEPIKEEQINLEPSYWLSKVKNWKLVTNFVPGSIWAEENFKKIQMAPTTDKSKFYIVYDEKYEDTVERVMDENKPLRTKIKSDIYMVKQGLEHISSDIDRIKRKIYENEWKNKMLKIKQDEIENALRQNTSDDA